MLDQAAAIETSRAVDSCLDIATAAATAAITSRFGAGAVDGKIQAYIIIVAR